MLPVYHEHAVPFTSSVTLNPQGNIYHQEQNKVFVFLIVYSTCSMYKRKKGLDICQTRLIITVRSKVNIYDAIVVVQDSITIPLFSEL